MRKFTDLKARVVRLGFSPEGTTLTAATRGGMQLGHWALPAGTFRRWHPYIDGAVSTFAYSPDGKWLVVGGDIGMALPYIRATDRYDSEIHSTMPVDALGFSSRVVPRRTVLAVGAARVRLYDLDAPYNSKDVLWDADLPSAEGWFRSVAFSPTADLLVGCDAGRKQLVVWNPVTRERVEVVVRKSGPTAAAFSADGAHLMVAFGAHVQLLDPRTWATVAVCKHPRGKVTDVAASPAGAWFATAGTDGTVRLWDAATGAAGRVFDWKAGPLTAVAFAPDGLTCAAAGLKGKVVVWDVDE